MKNKVMIFGTFDGFHPGHDYFLKKARKYGKVLIAVVTSDEKVLRLKKHPPKICYWDRVERLTYTENPPDVITPGDENQSWQVLRTYKPDMLVLGYDQYRLEHHLPDMWKKRVKWVDSYYPETYKSSILNQMTPSQQKVFIGFSKIFKKQGSCTIAELSRKIKLSQSTVSEHLKTLFSKKYVKWSSKIGYQLKK